MRGGAETRRLETAYSPRLGRRSGHTVNIMEWMGIGICLLTFLSSLTEVQVSCIQPSTTSANSLDPATSLMISSMPHSKPATPIPTPIPVSSATPIPTPSSMPSPTPCPTPSPRSEFLKYQNDTLYLIIEEVYVRYKETEFNTSKFTSLCIINTTLNEVGHTQVFRRYYSQNGKENFFISFIFMRDNDAWYIDNFMHLNLSEPENARLLFQYSGMQFGVRAPINKAFKCSSLAFHGTTGERHDATNSSLTFKGLTVQGFTKNGRISLDPIICDEDPQPQKDINTDVIIGVVVGVSAAASVVSVVLVTVVITIKLRRRDYDLLD